MFPIPHQLKQGLGAGNINSTCQLYYFWHHNFHVASKWHIPISSKGGISAFPGRRCCCYPRSTQQHSEGWLKGKSLSWKGEQLLSALFSCWNKSYLKKLKISAFLVFSWFISDEWNPRNQWEEQIHPLITFSWLCKLIFSKASDFHDPRKYFLSSDRSISIWLDI